MDFGDAGMAPLPRAAYPPDQRFAGARCTGTSTQAQGDCEVDCEIDGGSTASCSGEAAALPDDALAGGGAALPDGALAS